MSLKRQNNMMSAFSMASMTDIVFLLLIFFMVTSTFVFPTAIDVNLPQSDEQTSTPPDLCIIASADGRLFTSQNHETPEEIAIDQLYSWLLTNKGDRTVIAFYGDVTTPYGVVAQIISIGKAANVKVVLATKPVDNLPGVVADQIDNSAAETAPEGVPAPDGSAPADIQ